MKAVIVTGVLAATGGVFYTATDALSSSDATAQIAVLEADAAAARINLETQNTALGAKVTELVTQNKDLTGQLDADRVSFEAALDAAKQEVSQANAEIARLESISAQSPDLTAELTALQDSNATLQAENAAFVDQNSTLRGETAELKDALAALEAELQSLETAPVGTDDVSASLRADLEAAQAEVATLQGRTQELEAELTGATATIADLEAAAAAPVAAVVEDDTAEQIAALQAALDEQAQALEAAQASHADATAELSAKLADYEVEVASLNTALGHRDEEISALWSDVVTTPAAAPVAQGDLAVLMDCQARTNAVLADSSIGFDSGRTSITTESVALLEELSLIASDCFAKDLALDIEGHTDSAGTDANNLALSYGRAQAVFDFLVEREMPVEAMRAVGFGETDPIADNETTEGRAENRRIVFDWAQR